MKSRYAALAIALGSVLAFVVLAASHNDSARGAGPGDVVPAAVEEQPRAAPVAPSNPTTAEQKLAPPPAIHPAQVDQPPAAGPQQPAVRTGCGKAVPCPNRDCKDCPYNMYLK